jgi:hypothetical protein
MILAADPPPPPDLVLAAASAPSPPLAQALILIVVTPGGTTHEFTPEVKIFFRTFPTDPTVATCVEPGLPVGVVALIVPLTWSLLTPSSVVVPIRTLPLAVIIMAVVSRDEEFETLILNKLPARALSM